MSTKIHPRTDKSPPGPSMESSRTLKRSKTLQPDRSRRDPISLLPRSRLSKSSRWQKPSARSTESDCNASSSRSEYYTVSPFIPPSKDGKPIREKWMFGGVLDPHEKVIKKINRVFLLVFTLGLFIDPLFLDCLTIDDQMSCLYVDKSYISIITGIRGMVDGMYLWHMWLQLKLAYVSRESLVPGRGELVWDAKDVALNYICRFTGLFFDLFVILPIPQVMLWIVVPYIVNLQGTVTEIMTYMLIAFLFQYIPKIFHLFLIIRRMRHVTGYVFGTAWWGFGLNLISYVLASHVAGTVWYLLGLQRVERCLQSQCVDSCRLEFVGCTLPIASPNSQPDDEVNLAWGQSNDTQLCFTSKSDYPWGIYTWAIPLTKTDNGPEKFMFPLFWGIMTVSSFGNSLTPTNNFVEATFCVVMVTFGLLLFSMLIGNIQVFLQSTTAKKVAMQLKMRDIEWWMKRRQLPRSVRQRVRQSEREKWAESEGVEEAQLIAELPEGLRRDVKRHLCVDLVRKVPLFDDVDELVIDNICDRLKPLLFIRGETIVEEGEPVHRMVFVARGHVQSTYRLQTGSTGSVVLNQGNFAGDELIGWLARCFRTQQFDSSLPPSASTLTTLSDSELYGLDFEDLVYIAKNFRHKFDSEKLKNTARYWSSNWRAWAAVTIQLAWRRFKQQRDNRREAESNPSSVEGRRSTHSESSSMAKSQSPLRTSSTDETLRLYAAIFYSPKPADHGY
ncbi:unnamed protein product [Calypogeia fissa]